MTDESIRSRLEAIAPEAARIAISGWVQAERDTPAVDLIRMAVAKLPATGRIRGKKETVVKGLTWLLNEVPADDPGRDELCDTVAALVDRAKPL
jgi:hypothetical protein